MSASPGPGPAGFLADLEAKPAALERLAGLLDGGPRGAGDEEAVPIAAVPRDAERVVLLGMGSSRYAAEATAARLRAGGIAAAAELASAVTGTAPGPGTLVVAISVGGTSRETLDALERHRGRSRIVAVTNEPGSPVTEGALAVLPLAAGPETGGVACRTFQHTLVVLRAVEGHLLGRRHDAARLARRVAAATAELLDRRGAWLEEVADALDGPDGLAALAPAERVSSALQAALVVREGPRRPAAGSETGDWSHVDVYLAKTLDYRALLFAGSRYDEQALGWLRRRGSTIVAVGGEVAGARAMVRYAGDDDPEVAVATETLVAELVAARWWAAGEWIPRR